MIALNRAVAHAESDGLERGLCEIERLELDGYRYFHSARADLLRRLGRDAQARDAYLRALELTSSDVERRFLERRLEGLGG